MTPEVIRPLAEVGIAGIALWMFYQIIMKLLNERSEKKREKG